MVRPAFRAPSSQEGEAFLAKLGRSALRDREAVSRRIPLFEIQSRDEEAALFRAARRLIALAGHRLAVDENARRPAGDGATAAGAVTDHGRGFSVDEDVGHALDDRAVARGVADPRRRLAVDHDVIRAAGDDAGRGARRLCRRQARRRDDGARHQSGQEKLSHSQPRIFIQELRPD